ncbi:hypothetical protein TYRP_012022 [Tyrophagus putrescentiae]|nr:hypothetical protein TYRP_012022 [Tyrophagus putrescentiae]
MSSFSVIFLFSLKVFLFIAAVCFGVAWTFSYSYSINHGGNARSSVSFSRGWPANSRSNYRLNPHFRTAHYSPPNGIQYRPQTQPVPLLPPQSPPPLAPINSQPPPPQTPQFQPPPPPQPLPAPGKPLKTPTPRTVLTESAVEATV